MKQLTPTGAIQVNVPAGQCRFYAADDSQTYEILLPLEQFLHLAGRVQQESVSHSVRIRASGLSSEAVSALPTPAILPKTVEVGAVTPPHGPRVAIVLDRDSAGEIGIGLSPNVARALGEQLIAYAENVEIQTQ